MTTINYLYIEVCKLFPITCPPLCVYMQNYLIIYIESEHRSTYEILNDQFNYAKLTRGANELCALVKKFNSKFTCRTVQAHFNCRHDSGHLEKRAVFTKRQYLIASQLS